MKTLFFTAFFLLSFTVVSLSQVATPSPVPGDSDVVKISTNLIQIDVTVTDKKGKIITDLRRDELEIFENGTKQDISNFSFISNLRESVEQPKERRENQVSLPPAAIRPENVKRTIALVVDDLTLSFESTYFVRRALKKFVDEQMADGDLVAIIRTGAGIGALQQFTADRRQLYAAIENVKWNPVGSGGISAFAPLEAPMPDDEEETEEQPGVSTAEGRRKEFDDFRKSVFATGTLGAINYVIRGMSKLPGRKSVLLLSDGFKLFTKDSSGFTESTRILESLRRLIDQANRASVVIYTMDARGLQYTGLSAADNTGGRTQDQLRQAESDRGEELRETQDGLRYLARETGGMSIVNNNDLSGGIRRILDDQSYYLVGYEPDAETFDPKQRRFNKLEIRVTRPGARVRYRSGFFGVANDETGPSTEAGSQSMLTALMSPFAVNDIPLRLNALFSSSAAAGPVVRSLLHISAKDLTFTDGPDGSKKAVFDVLAVGFGENGVPVEQISKTYTLVVKKEQFAQFIEKGVVYDFTFPIKKPGAYQLRVALRDNADQKVGSANQFIEVPNLKNKRLTLSGVILESVPYAFWEKRMKSGSDIKALDPRGDTSLRQFKTGSVLTYGFTIYNPKILAGRPIELTSQIRLFLDGKQIFEGKPQPIVPRPGGEPGTAGFTGSFSFGSKLAAGEYVMQITVTDNLAKVKHRTAVQFVQFDIID